MLFYNPRQILETWLVLDWNFSHLPPFLLDTTVFETSSDNCFLLNLLFLSMWNNFFLNSAMFLVSTIRHPFISSLNYKKIDGKILEKMVGFCQLIMLFVVRASIKLNLNWNLSGSALSQWCSQRSAQPRATVNNKQTIKLQLVEWRMLL